MTALDKLADRHERLQKRHEQLLGSQVRESVVLIGDRAYLQTFAGQVAWALLLNLTVRLYKGIRNIRIAIDHDIGRLPKVFFPNSATNLRDASRELIAALHTDPSILQEGLPPDDDDSWIRVYVGGSCNPGPTSLTVGGIGWLAFVNDDSWRQVRPDENPIGPMVAACFGAAEIYKRLYSMRGARFADKIVLSAFDFSNRPEANPALPDNIHIPKTYVAGAGAVGMALLLLLNSFPVNSSAGIEVVDFDPLDDTNLNRCILAVLDDIGDVKTDIVSDRVDVGRLAIHCHPEKWQEFVKHPEHSAAHNFERIISCVDRYDARRAVQYDRVPKVLLTAGTGDFLLTVSRHVLDDGLACGLCYQARDADPDCARASDGAAQAFEIPIDPSIGFVSVLTGVLLGAEFLKEVTDEWKEGRAQNTVRIQTLSSRASVHKRSKDPSCNCGTKYVALGYKAIWRKRE